MLKFVKFISTGRCQTTFLCNIPNSAGQQKRRRKAREGWAGGSGRTAFQEGWAFGRKWDLDPTVI